MALPFVNSALVKIFSTSRITEVLLLPSAINLRLKFRRFHANGCRLFTSAQNKPFFCITAQIDIAIIQQIILSIPINIYFIFNNTQYKFSTRLSIYFIQEKICSEMIYFYSICSYCNIIYNEAYIVTTLTMHFSIKISFKKKV